MIPKRPHQRFKMSGKDATLDGLVHDYAEIHASHTTKAIPTVLLPFQCRL
jgi:hypothetical protein